MRIAMAAAGVGLVVLLVGPATAASSAPRTAPADLPWLDPEEAAALLGERKEAGLAPADLDLAGLVRQPARIEDNDPSRPTWSCHLESDADGRSRAALDGHAGPIALRMRLRRGLDDAPHVGGCLWMDSPHLAVGAGGVAVQHGLGLLAAGPSRSRTASISGSLLAADSGPRHWSSPDGAAGIRGLVAEVRSGAVAAGAMVGRQEQSPAGAYAAERAAWLSFQRDGLSIAALVCPGPQEPGRSLAVAATRGQLDLRAETTAWGAPGARAAATAAAARWRQKGLAIEALAAVASAPAEPRFGTRPACLIGWDGRGWAVRGRLAFSAAVTGTILVAAAEDHPARTTARDRAARHAFEAGVNGRVAAGGTWALRWRRREDLRWVHDEAAPWPPPALAQTEVTETFVAESSWPLRGGLLAGAIRGVVRESGPVRGRRAVASLVWRGPCRGLRATFGGNWAWGEAAAVSTVTTPVSGLVVPRSWSQWAAEVFAGAELRVGPGRIQAAAARRTPALLPRGPASWEGWLRLAVVW
jgi:hypothetical protein